MDKGEGKVSEQSNHASPSVHSQSMVVVAQGGASIIKERPHFDTSMKRPPPKPPGNGNNKEGGGGGDKQSLSSQTLDIQALSTTPESKVLPPTGSTQDCAPKRLRIVQELLNTERTYVKNLEIVIEVTTILLYSSTRSINC